MNRTTSFNIYESLTYQWTFSSGGSYSGNVSLSPLYLLLPWFDLHFSHDLHFLLDSLFLLPISAFGYKLYAFGYTHYCFVDFNIDSIPFEIYFMKSIYFFFSRSSFKFIFIICRTSFQSSLWNLMSYYSIFPCVRTLSKNRIILSII